MLGYDARFYDKEKKKWSEKPTFIVNSLDDGATTYYRDKSHGDERDLVEEHLQAGQRQGRLDPLRPHGRRCKAPDGGKKALGWVEEKMVRTDGTGTVRVRMAGADRMIAFQAQLTPALKTQGAARLDALKAALAPYDARNKISDRDQATSQWLFDQLGGGEYGESDRGGSYESYLALREPEREDLSSDGRLRLRDGEGRGRRGYSNLQYEPPGGRADLRGLGRRGRYDPADVSPVVHREDSRRRAKETAQGPQRGRDPVPPLPAGRDDVAAQEGSLFHGTGDLVRAEGQEHGLRRQVPPRGREVGQQVRRHPRRDAHAGPRRRPRRRLGLRAQASVRRRLLRGRLRLEEDRRRNHGGGRRRRRGRARRKPIEQPWQARLLLRRRRAAERYHSRRRGRVPRLSDGDDLEHVALRRGQPQRSRSRGLRLRLAPRRR